MATTKRAAVDMNTLSSLKAERLNYKTPKERARINENVTVEQRLEIVEERKKREDGEKIAQIHPKFTDESRTYSVVSSLALFFGSPVGAELMSSGTVEYQRNSQNLIKWRIDEFFKSRAVNDVMTSICDAVLGADDEELIRKVRAQINDSNAISDRKKKSVNLFFEKLFQFRTASQSRRKEEIKDSAWKGLNVLPEEELKAFLQSRGYTFTGSTDAVDLSSEN
jgi:hypothetical protein